jgi:outer membrane protein insertion porin family
MSMRRWYLSTCATTFCAALVFLSIFSTTISMAGGSSASNADIERGTSTPQIEFVGNRVFSSEKLLEVLSRTRWFTGSGSINPNALHEATDNLVVFYYDDGFLDVQVHEPQIASADRATIQIYEGSLYRIGSIAIEGRLRFPRREVESQLTMRGGQPFRGSTLQLNALALEDFYADRGFAFVYVDPLTRINFNRHLVDVRFVVKPGDETWINQITISGNTTTPEHVIRAALRIHEHELYSARAVRESVPRLVELGLGTRITTQPSTKSGEINVRVTISERSKV